MIPDIKEVGFFYFVAIFFVAIVVRYFITAGAFFWYFNKFNFKKWKQKKLNPESNFDSKQFRKEIGWSIISSVIFAFAGAVTIWLFQLNYTAIYTELGKYGYWYLPISLVIPMFIHETYYYWVHRWMHKPHIFRKVHKVHHESIVTSPWTAFSFHPLEAFIEALILPVILIIIPMHLYILGLYLIIMTISSIINHLDIELYPGWFRQHWLGKNFIGATHHHYHHKEFKTNYGLYFTFWDQWMGTENVKYNREERRG